MIRDGDKMKLEIFETWYHGRTLKIKWTYKFVMKTFIDIKGYFMAIIELVLLIRV